jgi:polyphenol oxidase
MTNWLESPEAIGAVDAILAGVGLEHGRRSTREGSWKAGERIKKQKSSLGKSAEGKSRTGAGLIRVPGWDRWTWLNAGFSTRQGGFSEAYGAGEQNLGWTKEDDAALVARNRERFVRAVSGKRDPQLVTIRQIHSGMIRIVEADRGELSTADGKAVLRGDTLMTGETGLLLGVQTADCVPVLLADTRTRAVAAFHAGWRGTLARIVERGVGTMRLRYGSRPKDLIAAIGPAIGACCFAVGEDVRFDFESQFVYAPKLFSEVYDSDPVRDKYPLLFMTARAPGHSEIGPQIHLDLVEANRRQLLDAGVAEKRISVVGECTSCARLRNGKRKYFSHRGEHGFTGRMLSVIGAVGD